MHSASPCCDIVALVEEHYDLLYRYAYRLCGSSADAEDMTQQAFLTAQACGGQLREAAHAKGWLFTILRNIYLKSRRNHPDAAIIPLEFSPEPIEPPADEFPIDGEELQAALQELPAEFREAIVLYYFQEFSYREIADQLAVPIGTVMSRLARGKAWLRRRLAGCLPASHS